MADLANEIYFIHYYSLGLDRYPLQQVVRIPPDDSSNPLAFLAKEAHRIHEDVIVPLFLRDVSTAKKMKEYLEAKKVPQHHPNIVRHINNRADWIEGVKREKKDVSSISEAISRMASNVLRAYVVDLRTRSDRDLSVTRSTATINNNALVRTA
ncbi:hypothetical protein JYU14_05115 [Simkania negevensis]|uniref:Uncharacterized protein n=1 Tax=Simkania negevensis TaxID=83561 RepID=A0ABS3ASX2_9BACT|nr:hypothetical protein [Simkania negevensis]